MRHGAGLLPVAGDMSLPSGFKKHLKSVSTRISGKRDIPMDERTIHGDALAFFVVPQFLSNIPDFACYKIHALKARTPLLLWNTHQVGKIGQEDLECTCDI